MKRLVFVLTCVFLLFIISLARSSWDGDIVNIRGYIGNSWRNLRIDSSTNSIVSITQDHHKIHEGDHFFIDDAFPLVGSGVTKVFGVTAPSGAKEIHMTYIIGGSKKLVFEMYEGISGTTFFNGGTAINLLNNKRNNDNVSSLSVVLMPNHVQTGVSTRLFHKIFGTSGVNPAKPGTPGGGGRSAEVIFIPGRKYLVLFTSGEADNDINYTAEWYEHQPKN